MSRIWRCVNQPFVVTFLGGLLVLCIGAYLQHRSWEYQNKALLRQAQISGRISGAQATEEEVVRRVGQLLTAEALIVGAHEGSFDLNQLKETIAKNAGLRDEWDLAEEALKLRVRTSFSDRNVQRLLQELLSQFDPLYEDVEALQAFSTNGPSDGHKKQIAACRSRIGIIESKLEELTNAMTRYIDAIQ